MNKIDTCILFSTADWDARYWTNKQHTAINLASRGIAVLYIESIGLRQPKISSGGDLFRIFRRLFKVFRGIYKVKKNIYVLSPLVIPFNHHWFLVRWFNQVLLSILINSFINRIQVKGGGGYPIVWSYHPYALDSIPRDSNWPIVYHCVDDLSAVPGVNKESFNLVEQDFLGRADIVFTTSDTLHKKCQLYSGNVFNFPNVVDFEHFSQGADHSTVPDDLKLIPGPRIGYVGVISDFKIDLELLFNVVKHAPQWQFIFIGEEREGQSNPIVAKLKLEKNTHFLGYRKYDELPIYLSNFDVAILPALINTYTKSMFPMKYFEYVASGLSVVSTAFEFMANGQEAVIVANNHESFCLAIKSHLESGKISLEKRTSIIGENTWKCRLDKMIRLIENIQKNNTESM